MEPTRHASTTSVEPEKLTPGLAREITGAEHLLLARDRHQRRIELHERRIDRPVRLLARIAIGAPGKGGKRPIR